MTKVLRSQEQLVASGLTMYKGRPPPAIKALGVIEVPAAIGLILPAVTGIAPILVPLAATGLVVMMVGAMPVHARRRELPYPALNSVLLILSAVLASCAVLRSPGEEANDRTDATDLGAPPPVHRRWATGRKGFGWRTPELWSTTGSAATTGGASSPSSIASPSS
ncbi:DoxX family protein [Streptomyces sp. NPDC007162]|uniref:DoxX family protein n=1 Tax=Streptomyces sp. NPDC007162 TaxID=3156917 RepID=UPI0034031B79